MRDCRHYRRRPESAWAIAGPEAGHLCFTNIPLNKRRVKQINTEILTHGGCFIEVQAIIRFKNGPDNEGHSYVPDSDLISGITEVPLKF